MPNYNVHMGQGVTIPNLVGNMLLTGSGRTSNLVRSCSAVILVNTTDWRAGLYHFPAGSINSDEHSKTVIRDMQQVVAATRAYIAFGRIGMIPDGLDDVRPGQREQGEQLKAYVLDQLPKDTRLTRIAAKGYVTVTSNAGNPVIGDEAPSNFTDLRTVAAGNHELYTIYGHAL